MWIHRIVGPRLAAGLSLAALALAAAPPAFAFCRFTTCASSAVSTNCRRDANGCYLEGIPLAWKPQCVSYSMSQAASPVLGLDYATAEQLAQQGFNLWPTTSCGDTGAPSIAVKSLGPITCDRVAYYPTGPNSNGIIFRDRGWERDRLAIALTTVMFNWRTGEILGADMEINSETFPDLTPQNLAYVFAHEAGHFLGLDHSPVASALMFATYALDSSAGPPALGPDDIAGICTAYPPTRAPAASCNFEPVRGFAPDCGGNVVGGCAVAAAPAPTAWGAAGGLSALALAAVSLALGARSRLIRHRRAGRRRPARAPGQSPPSPPPL